MSAGRTEIAARGAGCATGAGRPEISVIIPARDAEATIDRCLDAIAAQRGPRFEVVLADDGSHDRTRRQVEAHPVGARLVVGPFGGPGAARNAAVALARAPRLAFCDADCFPAEGWLAAGVSALERLDLCQGRVIADPDAKLGPFDRTIEIGGLHGLFEAANLFCASSWFDRVGGFEDWLGLESGKGLAEDTLLGWRMQRAGARVGFEPEALAHHQVFGRSARGYAVERGRLRYFPALVARVPELRQSLCYRRWFLNAGSARLDLALTGCLTAIALAAWSEGVRAAPAAIATATAAPYANHLWRGARDHGRRAPAVAAAEFAAGVVGAAALIAGSLRARTVLI